MRLVGHRVDLADGIGDADRADRLLGAQARQRAVVMARAIADAMAAPVERGERHEQQIRIDARASRRRFGDVHRAGDGRLARAASGGKSAARRARR